MVAEEMFPQRESLKERERDRKGVSLERGVCRQGNNYLLIHDKNVIQLSQLGPTERPPHNLTIITKLPFNFFLGHTWQR